MCVCVRVCVYLWLLWWAVKIVSFVTCLIRICNLFLFAENHVSSLSVYVLCVLACAYNKIIIISSNSDLNDEWATTVNDDKRGKVKRLVVHHTQKVRVVFLGKSLQFLDSTHDEQKWRQMNIFTYQKELWKGFRSIKQIENNTNTWKKNYMYLKKWKFF